VCYPIIPSGWAAPVARRLGLVGFASGFIGTFVPTLAREVVRPSLVDKGGRSGFRTATKVACPAGRMVAEKL